MKEKDHYRLTAHDRMVIRMFLRLYRDNVKDIGNGDYYGVDGHPSVEQVSEVVADQVEVTYHIDDLLPLHPEVVRFLEM